MIDLQCKQCGYKFKGKVMPSRCPYCSKQDAVGLVKTAQDLIDETVGKE